MATSGLEAFFAEEDQAAALRWAHLHWEHLGTALRELLAQGEQPQASRGKDFGAEEGAAYASATAGLAAGANKSSAS